VNRFDEAEPLEQLSKLDVVVGNGAEQENQLESVHAHPLFFVLGSAEQSTREAQGFVFLLRVLRPFWNGELERSDQLGDSREDWAVVERRARRRRLPGRSVRLGPGLSVHFAR
jgi:hypothetical protein